MDENNSYILGQLTSGALIALSFEERRHHAQIIGRSGSGKSTLLQNLMRADLASKRGFALIDPHGDLAQAIADAAPVSRTNDIIYFDPLDTTHAVGFNPLANVPPLHRGTLAAGIVSSFKHIWHESWGPRLDYILTNAVRLLLENRGSTLVALPALLTDDSYRAKLLAKCTDPFIKAYWEGEFAHYPERLRAEAISPIQNKVGQFANNPILRAIIGQRTSTLDIPRIMNSGKILIANLSKKMGEEPSHLLGALLATAFAQAAEARADMPEHERQDFTLYVDEFQNFATTTFASILSEARKFRLNLVLANQYLDQLPDGLKQAVLGNVGTLVVFRVGAIDAPLLARELNLSNPQIVSSTANFEAWIKLLRGRETSDALLIVTVPPKPGEQGRLPSIISRTRARHARPREQVEEAVAAMFRPARKGQPWQWLDTG